MTPPAGPSVSFLADALAAALLHEYRIQKAPVPIREFVTRPLPDLKLDVSLAESPHFTFCRAMWIRPLDGQGVIFLNASLPEDERRYELACALFAGLAACEGARLAELSAALNRSSAADRAAYAQRFARSLLLPGFLLPPDWQTWSDGRLAQLFVVPTHVVSARRAEVIALLNRL